MGSVAASMDVNKDGFLDLFIGGRVVPSGYPASPGSMILINDGHGKFTNQTKQYAPDFLNLGMVTDAKWVDINKNNIPLLIICGEWMSMKCFSLENNQFVDKTDAYFDKSLSGLWNKIEFSDIDNDGDLDMIAGNWGTNSQFTASENEPMTMYYDDFDKNGFIDPIICQYNEGVSYPMATRDELTDQIVSLRQKFPNYEKYSTATIQEIFSKAQIDISYKRRAPKKLWKHKCLVHFHTKILYDLSATKSQFGRLKICCRNLGRSHSEKRQHPKHSSRVSCHAFL
jgi:hypothetical protein